MAYVFWWLVFIKRASVLSELLLAYVVAVIFLPRYLFFSLGTAFIWNTIFSGLYVVAFVSISAGMCLLAVA
jgi:hypothetical protein